MHKKEANVDASSEKIEKFKRNELQQTRDGNNMTL